MAAHLTISETENKVTKANLLQIRRCIDGQLPCKELFLGRLSESVEILENSCIRLSSLELNYIRLFLVRTLKRHCSFWDVEQLYRDICSIIDAKLSIPIKPF